MIKHKDKALPIKDHLEEIKPYLSDIINNHKTQGEWKFKLTMAIDFFFLKILKKLLLCIAPVII